MFLDPAEMHIQLVQVLQQGTKRSALGHLCKCVDILWKTLTTVTELAVRAGDVCVGIVDIAGEEDASMYLAPVGAHLIAVLATGVEVGHLIGSEHVVHVLGQLGLKRCHHSELFADKYLS